MQPTLVRRLLTAATSLLAMAPLLIGPTAAADPQPTAAGWSATGSMAVPRERAAGVLLNDGRVLVMGGRNCGSFTCTYHASSEIYNPATGTWSAGPTMSTARTDFQAVVLGNGKVLAIGGANGTGNQSADLYSPATNTFSSGGTFSLAMDSGFVAVVLSNGYVLVVGGCCGGAPYNQGTVLYNPVTNTWFNGPNLSTARFSPNATLLPSGKVLIAGGIDSAFNVLASTELFNPANNTVAPGPTMFDARWSAQAALTADGRVLLVGGSDGGCVGATEVYNPSTNTFSSHKTGLLPRADDTATPILTNDGKMLVAGGDCSPTALQSAGLYNSSANSWQGTASLNTQRRDHLLIRLRSGQVLAAGGGNYSVDHASAELYTPLTTPTAYATPNPVQRGLAVTIAGSGFQAGETVRLTYRGAAFANPVADASGNFSVAVGTSTFPARAYIDRAQGLSSGRIAWFHAPIVSP